MDELANSPLPLRYKTASAVDPKATGAIARIVVEAIDSYNTEGYYSHVVECAKIIGKIRSEIKICANILGRLILYMIRKRC